MDETLRDLLGEIGKPTEVYESPDGTQLLLLPYGARTLGLYAHNSHDNFFWTNPSLSTLEGAKTLFRSVDWHNTGGDRTWIAPEIDIFFPNYPDTQMHSPPRQLDAGDYILSRNDAGIRMEKSLSVKLARPGKNVQLKISKHVAGTTNPLRYETRYKNLMKSIRFAGYSQRTILEIFGRKCDAKLGLWNLIQVPHGGQILIPSYSRCEPKILFGDISSEDLLVSEHLIRFKSCGSAERKISVRAVASTGRIGYLCPMGQQWALLVRNFFINPSGEYVDVPKDDLHDLGYAVQAVDVDSGLGSFCELEYHVPALEADGFDPIREDESQVWAFQGSYEDMCAVAQALLTPEA